MRKVAHVLGFISLFLFVFSVIMMFQFLFGSSNGDWSDLGFLLIGIILAIAAAILTIPFIVMIFKVKIRNMKFYFFSHLAYLLMSGLTMMIALNIVHL